jgi:hypothetical protein
VSNRRWAIEVTAAGAGLRKAYNPQDRRPAVRVGHVACCERQGMMRCKTPSRTEDEARTTGHLSAFQFISSSNAAQPGSTSEVRYYPQLLKDFPRLQAFSALSFRLFLVPVYGKLIIRTPGNLPGYHLAIRGMVSTVSRTVPKRVPAGSGPLRANNARVAWQNGHFFPEKGARTSDSYCRNSSKILPSLSPSAELGASCELTLTSRGGQALSGISPQRVKAVARQQIPCATA